MYVYIYTCIHVYRHMCISGKSTVGSVVNPSSRMHGKSMVVSTVNPPPAWPWSIQMTMDQSMASIQDIQVVHMIWMVNHH